MGRVYFPTKNDIGKRTLSGVNLGSDYAGFRAPAEPAPRAVSTLATLGAMVSADVIPRSNIIYYGPNSPWYSGPQPIGPIVERPISVAAPSPAPAPVQAAPAAAPIAPAPVTAAPPVSQQTTPTPVVTIPPAQPTGAVLVTSGGGTASPNIAPAVAAPTPTTYTTDANGNIYNVQTGQMFLTAAQAATAGVTASSLTSGASSAAGAAASAAATPATAATTTSSSVTDQIAAWLGGSTSIGSYAVPNALLAAAVVLGFAFLEGGGSSGKKR